MTGTWPTGWVTGDIETAAEFKKGIGCIADQTLGGSAANIDPNGRLPMCDAEQYEVDAVVISEVADWLQSLEHPNQLVQDAARELAEAARRLRLGDTPA